MCWRTEFMCVDCLESDLTLGSLGGGCYSGLSWLSFDWSGLSSLIFVIGTYHRPLVALFYPSLSLFPCTVLPRSAPICQTRSHSRRYTVARLTTASDWCQEWRVRTLLLAAVLVYLELYHACSASVLHLPLSLLWSLQPFACVVMVQSLLGNDCLHQNPVLPTFACWFVWRWSCEKGLL